GAVTPVGEEGLVTPRGEEGGEDVPPQTPELARSDKARTKNVALARDIEAMRSRLQGMGMGDGAAPNASRLGRAIRAAEPLETGPAIPLVVQRAAEPFKAVLALPLGGPED
ncbi:hypothetical protein T484DRAFT_1779303, partial [Baffinella frigidus]